MKDRNFWLNAVAIVMLSLSAAILMTTGTEFSGILAGLQIAAGLSLMISLERQLKKQGRTDRQKAVMAATVPLFEIIALIGAFSPSVVPKWLAAITLGAVAFSELLSLELFYALKSDYKLGIGREGRIGLLALSLIGFYFHEYLLFYGLIILALVSFYDITGLVKRLSREV